MITEPAAIIAILSGICAGFFALKERTQWRVFDLFPPLLWIYATPVLLNNIGLLPTRSAAYDGMGAIVLPAFLVLMLLSVDLKAALTTMGRGVAVMLVGSFGVVIGATVACALAAPFLPENAWKLFGTLSGSWIGGTGNMAAVAAGLDVQDLGLPLLADNVVYVVWLPILLSSKRFAERFNRWAKVSPERMKALEAVEDDASTKRPIELQHVFSLILVVAAVTAVAHALANLMPEIKPALTRNTWFTIWLTTLAIAASFTRARKIPGSRAIGTALVYFFLAGMGARASLTGVADDALVFVSAAFLMITLHGAACLIGARLLRVDIHTAAIASAANVGGAASAPVVASHHKDSLVPASILMALIGYAAGNYLAFLAAQGCAWVAGAG
ncbi:MAG: DUF819 family protein [Myxococcota bacterium]